MKIKKTLPKKKVTFRLLLALIATILLVVCCFIYNENKKASLPNKPSEDQLDEGKRIQKEATLKDNAPIGSEDNPAISPESQQNSSKITVSSYISAKNQTDTEIQLRVNADALISNGSCSLSLSNNDSLYTLQSKTLLFANTTTCEGFNIPLSELHPGIWNVEINIQSDTLTSTINDNIEVK